jgi:hypothetical protein
MSKKGPSGGVVRPLGLPLGISREEYENGILAEEEQAAAEGGVAGGVAGGPKKKRPNPYVELDRLQHGVKLQPLHLGSDSHALDEDEAELDQLMDIPNLAEPIENYIRKVEDMITHKQKLLFPAVDKLLNKYSEVVFMGVAPLGYINPNADDNNCIRLYPICLDVTRRDIASVSYLLALRKEYNAYNIVSIPYIGPLLANIKLATSIASFVLSILSYRYTLIWLNSRLAALGGDEIAAFLKDFYNFCANPLDPQFEQLKIDRPKVFAVLYQVASEAISISTFVVLIHQFLSRQNRLAAAAAAGGGAQAPARGGIPGWNVPAEIGILGPGISAVARVVKTSVATTLKMFRPEICWAGFDAAPYVQGGITYADQRLSALLIRSSLAIEILSPQGNNLFVSAFLKMKYSHTFSMDGSIDKSEFKIVFIQERNKYVSEIMKVLIDRERLTYEEAKNVLRDVYPQAFEFSIQEVDLDDGSVQSSGSSVLTVIGSTASSRWRADQAVQGQQLAESTVFNWFLRKATHVLTTCSETILYGTTGVATLPGAYEPPIFGRNPTPSQLQAISRATHAVTVFDKWINTLQSDQFVASMVSGTTVTGLRRSLERIKLFYRLKCETKVLDSGDIVYVMDAENVTSLQNTIRSLQQVDQAETQTLSNCLSAILQYSRDPTQQQVMINLSQQEAASAAGERAAVGLPAVSGAAAGGEGVVGLPAARDELQESSQIALANIIPPVQILEAIVEPGAATGEDSPPEERAVVEQHLEDVIREQDALKGQAADNAGQGGGRSRKRSASKRTRRKGKQPSKKLKRKSRRYIRRRRSTRRKN